MENFRDRIVKEFRCHGFTFFRETVWSSSLQQADLSKIRNFLSKNNFNNIDVSLVVPQDDKTSRMRWSTHYQTSGQCISLMHQVPIPAKSNNLKLTFCYPSSEMRGNSRAEITVVANALRLVFGVPIARELLITSFFSTDEEPTSQSDEGFASLFDNQSLNIFDSPPIEAAELIKIPEEAAFLLDKAFAQTFPSERFILMWLAFEALTHTVIEKGSNGDKRKSFFKNILKSDIANDEVKRLFDLRCEIFKEGRALDKNIENDSWSLYAALQLLVMKDCEQRSAFLAGYENTVKERAPTNR